MLNGLETFTDALFFMHYNPAHFLSPQGWRWHSPSCFKVGEESLTFNDAKGMCASNNATLAIINNRYWTQA